MALNNFTHRGYAYPFRVAGGQLAIVEDADLKQCHIYHVLETELFENPMRFEYGTNHPLFSTLNSGDRVGSKNEYLNKIVRALETYVTDCTFSVDMSDVNDDGEAVLNIYWSYNDIEQEAISITVS